MKKIIVIALFLCICLCIGACNANSPELSTPTNQSSGTVTNNPAHTHKYSQWTISKEATCTENGEEKRTCECGAFETKAIERIAHTEVVDKAVAPTCTGTGLTEGKHCSVCNTVTVKQETIKANGHTEVVDKAVAATCTGTGLTEGKHCSVCNTVTVKQETIKAKGHTEVVDKAVAPTCTGTGLTEGKHCSVCNTVTVKQETVKAKGHTEEVITGNEPTCTTAGLSDGKKCSVCNTILIEQKEIPAKHNDPYGICLSCNEVTDEKTAVDHYVSVDTSVAQGKTCTTYYNNSLSAQYYISYIDYDVSIVKSADGKLMISVDFDIDASVIKTGTYYKGTGFWTYVISLNKNTMKSGYTTVSYGSATVWTSIKVNSIDELKIYANSDYPCFFVNVGDYYF